MKKAIVIIPAIMLFGIGCLFHVYGRQSGIYHKRQVITTLSKTYSNEYFSIDYPTGYEVEAYACRMVGGEIQRGEYVPVVLYLRTLGYREAHPGENADDVVFHD